MECKEEATEELHQESVNEKQPRPNSHVTERVAHFRRIVRVSLVQFYLLDELKDASYDHSE